MASTALNTTNELPPGVAALRELFKKDVTEGQSHTGAWNAAWEKRITPWDSKGVQPALKELIEENFDRTGVNWDELVTNGQSLVAGCGRVSLDHRRRSVEADLARFRVTMLLSLLKKDSNRLESTSLPSL